MRYFLGNNTPAFLNGGRLLRTSPLSKEYPGRRLVIISRIAKASYMIIVQ